MTRLRNWLIALTLFVLTPFASTAAETHPTVAVRLASVEQLLNHGEYIAKLVGQEEVAKQGIGFIKALAGEGNSIEGVNIKRPFGFYAQITENVLAPKAYLMIPVDDAKAFVGLLKDRAFIEVKEEKGIYQFPLPNTPVTVYFKVANKYAYFTALVAENLEDKFLPNPDTFFGPMDDVFDIRMRMDLLPDSIKKLALGQIETQLANAKKQPLEGATKLQKEFRNQGVDSLMSGLKSFLFEGKEMQIKATIDPKKEELSFEWNLTAVDGSALSKEIQDWKSMPSVFSGVPENAVMRVNMNTGLPKSLRKSLSPLVDEAITELIKKSAPQSQDALEKLLKSLAPSLKTGDMEAGVALLPANKDGFMTGLAMIKLKEGLNVEKTVKEIISALPGEIQNYFSIDKEKVRTTNLHMAATAEFIDEQGREIFGKSANLWFAVQDDRIILAFGPDAADVIKTSLSKTGATSGIMEMNLSLGRFLPIAEPERRQAIKAVAESIFGKEIKGDTITVRLHGGDRLQMRLAVPSKIIPFVAALNPNN